MTQNPGLTLTQKTPPDLGLEETTMGLLAMWQCGRRADAIILNCSNALRFGTTVLVEDVCERQYNL